MKRRGGRETDTERLRVINEIEGGGGVERGEKEEGARAERLIGERGLCCRKRKREAGR